MAISSTSNMLYLCLGVNCKCWYWALLERGNCNASELTWFRVFCIVLLGST